MKSKTISWKQLRWSHHPPRSEANHLGITWGQPPSAVQSSKARQKAFAATKSVQGPEALSLRSEVRRPTPKNKTGLVGPVSSSVESR